MHCRGRVLCSAVQCSGATLPTHRIHLPKLTCNELPTGTPCEDLNLPRCVHKHVTQCRVPGLLKQLYHLQNDHMCDKRSCYEYVTCVTCCTLPASCVIVGSRTTLYKPASRHDTPTTKWLGLGVWQQTQHCVFATQQCNSMQPSTMTCLLPCKDPCTCPSAAANNSALPQVPCNSPSCLVKACCKEIAGCQDASIGSQAVLLHDILVVYLIACSSSSSSSR